MFILALIPSSLQVVVFTLALIPSSVQVVVFFNSVLLRGNRCVKVDSQGCYAALDLTHATYFFLPRLAPPSTSCELLLLTRPARTD